jgi:hypothetical protein
MPLTKTGASGIFPIFERTERLTVLDARPYSWEEQLTAACIQGLVNREKPRIFLVHDDVADRRWLDIYRRDHGVKHREIGTFGGLVKQFAGELDGYVLCHEEMVHTMNVAQTWGSLHNAVAATPRVAAILEGFGLKRLEDFRGRFEDRIDAYEWALEHLLPDCNKRIIGHCCTEGWYPHKSHKYLPHIKDYLVAVKAFTFDLSARKRDRREYRLFDRILASMPEDGVMLGWHCAKCWESEYVALGARHGFFVFCNLRSPNYSAHAGVRTPGFRFTQKHRTPASVKVEDKVYVSFVHSDGDAIWAKNNFYARNWLDSQRGKFPCTWELQPYAVDFAPGQLEYYYRTRTENDYFIAGPSGAGYTAPIFNKYRDRFLANCRTYFKKTSIRSVLVMNRDPYAAFEELDNGDFPRRITEAIPEALGFVHGYGGNPFGESEFVGEVPYVQTAQYVGDMHDIYAEVSKFADLVPRRPIFVEVHVRESADFASLRSTCERLDPGVFKVVNLDEFLLAIRTAKAEGRITDLSLASTGLTERSRKQVEGWWPMYFGRIQTVANAVDLGEDQMLREFRAANLDFPWTKAELADILGWEAIDPMLRLLRSGLQARGVHENMISRAAQKFVDAYPDIPDAKVVLDCLELWQHWLERTPDLESMRALARRVVAVARTLSTMVGASVGGD